MYNEITCIPTCICIYCFYYRSHFKPHWVNNLTKQDNDIKNISYKDTDKNNTLVNLINTSGLKQHLTSIEK